MTGAIFFSETFISLSDPWFHFIRTPLSSGQSALGQSIKVCRWEKNLKIIFIDEKCFRLTSTNVPKSLTLEFKKKNPHFNQLEIFHF